MRGRAGLLLPAALGLAACTVLGPDPAERPGTAADDAAGFVNAPPGTEGPPDGRWWRSFGDPATEDLVVRALRANPDLAAAAARVLAANADLRAVQGTRLPQVDASLGAGVQRRPEFDVGSASSGSGSSARSGAVPEAGTDAAWSDIVQGSLSVRWQLDLFGRLERSEQAAVAEVLATDADRLALHHSLIASVVRARAQVATLTRREALARDNVESWRRTLELVDRRYRFGLVPGLDVRLARQGLASAEAVPHDLAGQLARARHALDVLLGVRPATGPALPDTLPPLPSLDPPPVGLPAALLDRRPDLVASGFRVEAARARVGVAIADLWPNLTLSGSASSTADALRDLLSSENLILTVLLEAAQPLFDGGTREARVDAARARAREAAARYASDVLVALREVEDALASEAWLRRRLPALAAAAEEAQGAVQSARDRYEGGTGSILEVLESERRRFQADDARLVAAGALWEQRVALHLALGGDFLSDDPGPDAAAAGGDR